MRAVRIAITIDRELLLQLDELVDGKQFANRSRAVQDAIREKLHRRTINRLRASAQA